MGNAVLDASAVLALLLGEPGAEAVRPHLMGGCISAVNYTEVVGHAARLCGSLDEAKDRVGRLDLAVVSFEAEQAILAASLLPITRPYGLSLADRSCLALGLVRNLPVVTADKVWKKLKCGLAIECIR